MPAPSWGKCISCEADNVGLIDDHCQDCHSKMFMDSLEPCQLQPGQIVYPLKNGRPDRNYPMTVKDFRGGWHDWVVVIKPNEPDRMYKYRRDKLIAKGY